jgi:serine/threonine-protein kinase
LDTLEIQIVYLPADLVDCMCLAEVGQRQAVVTACSSAAEGIEREIAARPHDYRLHIALGHALAILGRTEEAVRAGEHAVELMPISKDALEGSDQAIELAKIYARVGEVDKALDLIDELLSIPSLLSVGLLRLDPAWDPLRDDPRFQTLLETYDVER